MLNGEDLSLDAIEEKLVECHELWWRSPGGGKRPFAGDGPWHLMQGEVGDMPGEWSETLIETDAGKLLEVRKIDTPRPRTPLNSAEVAARDAMTAWLGWIEDPVDRRIVWYATAALHREEPSVPWKRLAKAIDWERSRRTLAWRYAKGLAVILCRLRGEPIRNANAIAARGFEREQPETRRNAGC